MGFILFKPNEATNVSAIMKVAPSRFDNKSHSIAYVIDPSTRSEIDIHTLAIPFETALKMFNYISTRPETLDLSTPENILAAKEWFGDEISEKTKVALPLKAPFNRRN